MRFMVVRVCALAIVGLVHTHARASAVLLSDDRTIEAAITAIDSGGTGQFLDGDSPSTSGENFAAAVILNQLGTPVGDSYGSGLASQNSSLSSNRSGAVVFDSLLATGRAISEANAIATPDSADGFAMTRMSVDFSLAAPHTYTIAGTLSESETSTGANATTVADAFVSLLSLDPPGGQEEFLQGAGSINAAGTLEPGVYRLIFQASADTNVDGDGTSSAAASFELMAFDLTEIPEPTTIGLLLVGVGIGVTKRRRTRVV